ncbi:hypothetical protein ASPWEDRAFT_24673 [Aspergillus wentii DTO 134E9]|uniref:Rhodopsin domain-containing protein n=1 Tax=Aspergillus wentii DTO 134E9 TaxID=1073089 RepID=A0A1L9RV28_ASPWE|nr:uncharacterized protein ASPWEDRAFT_24673 [Aspergillus wentii DTO 134E9]KAI9928688.1 hypothetical protein MW887_001905 [Aspergillus wentii]OJJ38776.1 hypothetical protein ASPWEDRAFT_24673 [Aspergillus wentii DTO 134E9]
MGENRSVAVQTVAAVFLALASVTTILRCYVRLAIVKGFGWDDGIMVMSMFFFAMFCGCMIGGSIYGTGKHLTDLSDAQRTTAMEYWFLCDIGYCISSILCKISVSIFILRITIDRMHRLVIALMATFVIITGIIFFVLLLVQCHPLSYFWMRLSTAASGSGTCISIDIVIGSLYAFSAASALFDLTIGVLPILLVRKLKMRTDVKMAVAGLLGMACIASIAVIVRIPYIHTLHNPDFLYATTGIAIWSNIETGLGIFAGSMATLRPLLRKFRAPTNPSSRTRTSPPSRRHRSVPLHSIETSHGQHQHLDPIDDKRYGSSFASVEMGLENESGADQQPILSKNTYAACINVRREVHVTSTR